jgi:nucleoside-diphosphate-sugar epimerase
LARSGQAPRLVYLSSLAAAGPSQDGHALRELEIPQPVSEYGRSKLEGEKALAGLGATVPWVIVRAPVIYGPRDRGLLPFFKLAKRGVAFRFGGRRDFSLCYVDDLVRGLHLAAERGRPGEIYYVAEEAPRSWEEIWDAIAEALGVHPLTIPLPPAVLGAAAWASEGIARLTGTQAFFTQDKAREMREPYWVCDPSKAGQDLSFATSIPLRTGTRRAVEWYKSYGWL